MQFYWYEDRIDIQSPGGLYGMASPENFPRQTDYLNEDRLEKLWPDGEHPSSILGSISPIVRGLGDISDPHVEELDDNLGLIVGDLGLSRFEARLSVAWPGCLDGDEAASR